MVNSWKWDYNSGDSVWIIHPGVEIYRPFQSGDFSLFRAGCGNGNGACMVSGNSFFGFRLRYAVGTNRYCTFKFEKAKIGLFFIKINMQNQIHNGCGNKPNGQ